MAYRTKKYLALNSVRMTTKFLEEFKKTLKLGKWYPVLKDTVTDEWKHESVGTEIRLIGIYPKVATFEDEFGVARSFDYWSLIKILNKEIAID